ncbi:MAG: biotin--[acetyl-CoA-carboxylase] ligase, partial [Vulcanimicrobiota bacterium]
NKKVGGILLESRFRGEKMDYLVAGIGINVNFSGYVLGSDLKFQPTTLYDESGKYYNLSELLASVLNRLDQTYYEFIKTGSIELIEYYKKKCMTLGRRIVVIYDDKIREKAWALDVLPDGSLKIKTIENNKEKIILNVQKICLL